ncbi:carbohydrate ABC transporter permease [Paenibacillus silvae]|uniref:carbohydrate ABC transporter permease n=1 Tax=Paenibacillus silvae TaxID=1325358 RepID=UPI00200327DD|nr:carbohydrate ABC transporter permease [Paenibacillus silvae]MCK6077410.1 carbohydrate ABC transporter permease [Paenibacillus silvae]MCK6151476.1 carbohydrate ABC transporter permease [Paenibacillus silvae]MCK6270095.1 carbohydrate ABC transporter permease [Paenibacillus silvae]
MVFKWFNRLILFVYALLILVPLYFVFVSSFKASSNFFTSPFSWPDPFTWDNVTGLFRNQPMWQYFGNSMVVTLGTVAIELLLSSMIAYAIVRWGGSVGKIVFALFVAGLIVPSQVSMLPIYSLTRTLGWSDSLTGLIIVSAAMLMPVSVFMLTGFMRMLNSEILEAGSMDGANEWRLFTRIALPLAAPSLAATATFLLVMVWNDLLIPMLMLTSKSKLTLPLALMQFRGEYVTNYPMMLTGVLVTAIPMIVLFLLLQRYFVAGLTAGSLKG